MRPVSSLHKYLVVCALTIPLFLFQVAKADDPLQPPVILTEDQATELLLNLSINGRDTRNVVIFLQDKQGNYYIQKNDLERYDLNLPDQNPFSFEGILYYPIASLSDQKAEVNSRDMSVNITIAAQQFKPSTLQVDIREYVKPTQPDLGGFLNYDVYAQQFDNSVLANGYFSPGIFYGPGSLVSGLLVQYNDFEDEIQEEDPDTSVVRLNSTLEFDFPDNMTSLYLGDSFNVPGIWGNSVAFGGIQFGTNFNTQPSFITFPMLKLSGEATMPSAVDLYMNGGMLSQQDVPPGPFTLNEIPVVNGAGMLTMVTTDMLGRQQTVTMPYYASTTLLKPGLHDYSVSLGFIRENYGYLSNDYGQFMFVGSDAFGLDQNSTVEVRLEALRDQQTLGGGLIFLFEQAATITMAAAGSHSEFGEGGLLEFGLTRQDQYGLNYGFNLIGTSRNFTQIGFGEDTVAPSFQGQYFFGTSFFDVGTLAASYLQQNNRNDQENQGFLTVSYSMPLFKVWAMNISATSTVQGEENNAVFLTFSRMFDSYTGLNLGGAAQTGSDAQGQAQLNRSLPLGPGFGYNLYAATGNSSENYQADISAQSDVGTYSVGAARYSDQMAYQAEISGSLAVIDNDVYLARALGASFGVVEVPGLADVQVYNYNQVVATTGKNGKAFMPNLLPYQINTVAIEPNDLPIGTEIQTAEMDMVPYFQSGLKITFPITSYYSAIARLVDSQGNALPSGTLITTSSHDGEMYVANEGEAYLNRLSQGLNQFTAQYNGRECTFSIDYIPDPQDQIPELGTLTCKE